MERQAGSSYCKFVIWKQDVFQVDDARRDPLVRQRHATRDLAIGAYLAVPIRVAGTDDRDPPIIGTLCAIDHAPREWSAHDLEVLTDIAAGSSEFIAARRHSRRGNSLRSFVRRPGWFSSCRRRNVLLPPS